MDKKQNNHVEQTNIIHYKKLCARNGSGSPQGAFARCFF